jgi:hypothetical protein
VVLAVGLVGLVGLAVAGVGGAGDSPAGAAPCGFSGAIMIAVPRS